MAVEQKVLKREWEVLRGREDRLTVPDPAKSEILKVLVVLEGTEIHTKSVYFQMLLVTQALG